MVVEFAMPLMKGCIESLTNNIQKGRTCLPLKSDLSLITHGEWR